MTSAEATSESLIKQSAELCGREGGRLLAGPHGPEIEPGDALKKQAVLPRRFVTVIPILVLMIAR